MSLAFQMRKVPPAQYLRLKKKVENVHDQSQLQARALPSWLIK